MRNSITQFLFLPIELIASDIYLHKINIQHTILGTQ